MTDRSSLGRRSRMKGKVFERVVKSRLVAAFNALPGLVIRRSSQAERAWDADLIIEATNAPEWLLGLWVECEHANDPDPWAKMVQAKRDATAATLRSGKQRTPVVIWRKTASKVIWLSTDLAWLNELLGGQMEPSADPGFGILATVRLEDVLAKLKARIA